MKVFLWWICPVLLSTPHSNMAVNILTNVCFCADLGSPKGLRFSDVTDTSATVHWVLPKVHVHSYKVTYVPAHGGQVTYMLSVHSSLLIRKMQNL